MYIFCQQIGVLDNFLTWQVQFCGFSEAQFFMYRINMEEKRRRLKREGKSYAVEEDDPIKFKLAVNILTMKLFADLERK